MLKDYFVSAAEHLIKLVKDIARIDRRNKEILMTKGDLDADKKDQLSNQQLLFDKLSSNTETLADLLGEDMPDLTIKLESETRSDEQDLENNEEGEAPPPNEYTPLEGDTGLMDNYTPLLDCFE